METPSKKPRMSRTTIQQFEIYLYDLERNVHLRENKFSGDPEVLNKSWKTLIGKLNAAGGPIKDVAGWKKTFADWKSQVRKKARGIKLAAQETGNQGPPEKPLTQLEDKLLSLTGRVVVDGLPSVTEIGITTNEDDNASCFKENDDLEKQIKEPQKVMPNKKGKTTISTTMQNFSELKDNGNNELRKINNNLKKIIEQNDTKIFLLKKKMELKYNIQFEDVSGENSE